MRDGRVERGGEEGRRVREGVLERENVLAAGAIKEEGARRGGAYDVNLHRGWPERGHETDVSNRWGR